MFVLKDTCQIMIPGQNSYFYILVGHNLDYSYFNMLLLCDKMALRSSFHCNSGIMMVSNNSDNR